MEAKPSARPPSEGASKIGKFLRIYQFANLFLLLTLYVHALVRTQVISIHFILFLFIYDLL